MANGMGYPPLGGNEDINRRVYNVHPVADFKTFIKDVNKPISQSVLSDVKKRGKVQTPKPLIEPETPITPEPITSYGTMEEGGLPSGRAGGFAPESTPQPVITPAAETARQALGYQPPQTSSYFDRLNELQRQRLERPQSQQLDPTSAALIQMGLSTLAQSGYRDRPVSGAEIAGQAGLAGLGAYQQAAAQQARMADEDYARQLELARFGAEEERAQRQFGLQERQFTETLAEKERRAEDERSKREAEARTIKPLGDTGYGVTPSGEAIPLIPEIIEQQRRKSEAGIEKERASAANYRAMSQNRQDVLTAKNEPDALNALTKANAGYLKALDFYNSAITSGEPDVIARAEQALATSMDIVGIAKTKYDQFRPKLQPLTTEQETARKARASKSLESARAVLGGESPVSTQGLGSASDIPPEQGAIRGDDGIWRVKRGDSWYKVVQ